MSAETQFIETEALLIAFRDAEADSGTYSVDAYLGREFLDGELRAVKEAAWVLFVRASHVLAKRVAVSAGEEGE